VGLVASDAGIPDGAFDHASWEARVESLARRYAAAAPYPHIVLEGLVAADLAAGLAEQAPALGADGWTHYRHINESKQVWSRRQGLAPDLLRVVDELNGERFRAWLSRLTGIPGLLPDPEFRAGGGLSAAGPGDFLNIHTDFTDHPYRRGWRRRVNLILYLNNHWDPAWGGATELWDRDVQRMLASVTPRLNDCLVFDTDRCHHGHPEPIRCPEGTARLTLALYYFSQEVDPPSRSTRYRPRPGDGIGKRLLIRTDVWLLRVYHWLKRRSGFSDRIASRVLESVSRLRDAFTRR
jgi:Rps23 Pro-64 3,4-dihydroxylase Tpa1-like proline 4-hydroxylase